MSEVYEVFAIKYGQRVGQRGDMLIHGDPHDAPMPMDYFIVTHAQGMRWASSRVVRVRRSMRTCWKALLKRI